MRPQSPTRRTIVSESSQVPQPSRDSIPLEEENTEPCIEMVEDLEERNEESFNKTTRMTLDELMGPTRASPSNLTTKLN